MQPYRILSYLEAALARKRLASSIPDAVSSTALMETRRKRKEILLWSIKGLHVIIINYSDEQR
jgi:hypothetical protein